MLSDVGFFHYLPEYERQSVDSEVIHSFCSLSHSSLNITSPSSEIKMAHRGSKIKIMALKALNSWSS